MNTSVASSGGAQSLVERIKLAQENKNLVQKLLAELAEQGSSKPQDNSELLALIGVQAHS